MSNRWIEGNDICLLENGEEFFPRVFELKRGWSRFRERSNHVPCV